LIVLRGLLLTSAQHGAVGLTAAADLHVLVSGMHGARRVLPTTCM
jgi:hypothetical protein